MSHVIYVMIFDHIELLFNRAQNIVEINKMVHTAFNSEILINQNKGRHNKINQEVFEEHFDKINIYIDGV